MENLLKRKTKKKHLASTPIFYNGGAGVTILQPSTRGPATCWPLLLVSFHLVFIYTPLTSRTGEELVPDGIWFGENI